MNEQELDKKLAKLAGFGEDSIGNLTLPGSTKGNPVYGGQPYLTQSLDACFKWLKPAVISRGQASIITWRTVLHNWLRTMATEKAMDDRPALALCLTIEKWLDAESLKQRVSKEKDIIRDGM